MKKKIQRSKKIAIRTCIACGKKLPKQNMVRFVRTSDDKIVVDGSGKLSGRGANLCAEKKCFDTAIKDNSLSKSLKTKVNDDRISGLRKGFLEVLEEREFRKGKKKVVLKVKKENIEDKIGKSVTRDKRNT